VRGQKLTELLFDSSWRETRREGGMFLVLACFGGFCFYLVIWYMVRDRGSISISMRFNFPVLAVAACC
jgi:hypothetical protein